MNSFKDFCKWAGTQRQAALMLGVSEATVSRISRGKQSISPNVAERCEIASSGLFLKERVLWPESVEKTKAA